MNARPVVMTIIVLIGLALIVALAAAPGSTAARAPAAQQAAPAQSAVEAPAALTAAAAAQDPLVLSYAAKFVCLEPLPAGTYYYGAVAPLVKESTGVLVHNPNDFPVTLYKKAVRAPVEEAPPIAPGKWLTYTLGPDYAFRIDCDDIAKLLTGNPQATFIGAYGIGVEVEGFVVIGIGPQISAAGTPMRYGPLDVTAEYVRGSEVMKKDMHYQPWWTWWWWGLPWRLGYAYNRIIPIVQSVGNIDCRGLLYDQLLQDTTEIPNPQDRALTVQALMAGRLIDPTSVGNTDTISQTALVAMVGGCRKLVLPGVTGQNSFAAEVDYVLLSNKGPTDHDPRLPPQQQPDQIFYPWLPGRWYDLPVVMPQNKSTDIDAYFRQWHTQWWIDSGVPAATVQPAMVYWFPYWCGWSYWWWWGNNSDCVDIGVGEGESLDVEQITPVRVFMSKWPPVP